MSGRINAVLRIELMSDLCSGSGYSYAGIIDSDICYDMYGIPYIPAKRIKGCLRDTLETVLYAKYPDMADKLFGQSGEDKTSDFVISDAVIEGYDDLKEQIARKCKNKDLQELYGAQNILGRFSHVLAQTKIGKDGAAEDGSLRYTRVVNQFSPLKAGKENLVFCSHVSFSDESFSDGSSFEKLMWDTVRATRHMGLKRNRGLGNVRCSLEEISRTQGSTKPNEKENSDKRVCISYTIHNIAPLMLSGAQEGTSRTYITGQSVLGALAGKYLQMQETDAADQTFQDLFLKGEAQFANAYPFEDGTTYYPAPLYINSLKKTEKYVNVIERKLPNKSEISAPDYDPDDGNQPKKLKGKYLFWDSRLPAEHEVGRDIVYHHRQDRKSGSGIEEGILYSMEVICPDQRFKGQIQLPGRYVPVMKEMLGSGDFYFGKSRSAQYGRCVIENCVDNIAVAQMPDDEKKQRLKFEKDDHLVVTFLSDALFLSERGEYTVYKEEVEEAVRKELGIRIQEDKNGPYLSFLQTTYVSGHMGKWNLRKDVRPAVGAGSYLVYKLEETFSESNESGPRFIGERTLEGYGQIRFDRAEDMNYLMFKEEPKQGGSDGGKDSQTETQRDGNEDTLVGEDGSQMLANLMLDVILDAWMEQMEYEYLQRKSGQKLKSDKESNTALGRITLMLKESLEEKKGKPEDALEEFAKRIGSIKSNQARENAEKYLKEVAEYDKDKKVWRLAFAQKILSGQPVAKDEPRRLGISEDELKDHINGRWGEYLMYILTERKYEGGGK